MSAQKRDLRVVRLRGLVFHEMGEPELLLDPSDSRAECVVAQLAFGYVMETRSRELAGVASWSCVAYAKHDLERAGFIVENAEATR